MTQPRTYHQGTRDQRDFDLALIKTFRANVKSERPIDIVDAELIAVIAVVCDSIVQLIEEAPLYARTN